jgi:hypothetical protein
MSDSELAILLYLANLTLLSRFSTVKTLCELHLIKLSNASSMFIGNAKKYMALAMLKMVEELCFISDEAANMERNKILKLLGEAHAEFETVDCTWGKAVTNLMAGFCYNLFAGKKHTNELQEDELNSCETFYTDALTEFESIKHYRGSLLSCQGLTDLSRFAASPSHSTELETKIKHNTMELQIIERTFN